MSLISKLKENTISAYSNIHGKIDITGEEFEMHFHGTQRPWEFFKAWEIIENYIPQEEEISFLEIGAAKGLWSIAFIEFCKLHNKKPVYVAVSLIDHSSLQAHEIKWNRTLINVKNYYGNQCEWVLFDNDSQKEETRNLVLKVRDKYDFVFIDGEHTYNAVFHDTRLYYPLTKKLLMYHDIGHPYANSVVKAIDDHNINLDYKIRVHENSEQGIGIHVVNN